MTNHPTPHPYRSSPATSQDSLVRGLGGLLRIWIPLPVRVFSRENTRTGLLNSLYYGYGSKSNKVQDTTLRGGSRGFRSHGSLCVLSTHNYLGIPAKCKVEPWFTISLSCCGPYSFTRYSVTTNFFSVFKSSLSSLVLFFIHRGIRDLNAGSEDLNYVNVIYFRSPKPCKPNVSFYIIG